MPEQPTVYADLVMKRGDGTSILDSQSPVTTRSKERTAGDLSEARIGEISKRLSDAGFHVEGGNSNTLSISGSPGLFAEVFGLDPAAAAASSTPAHATRIRRDLEPFVADVFVPPAPEFFR